MQLVFVANLGKNIIISFKKMSGTNGSALVCGLYGYRTMVQDILALSLTAITLNVSIIELVLSGFPDLSVAFRLLYSFLLGAGDWIGYLVAAIYFFGLEFGYGEYLCTASQYGFIVIYYLNLAISFGQSS